MFPSHVELLKHMLQEIVTYEFQIAFLIAD